MRPVKRFSIQYEAQATEHPFGPFMLFRDHRAAMSRIRGGLINIQNLPAVSGYSETYRIATDLLKETEEAESGVDEPTEILLLESALQDEKRRGDALLDGIRGIYAMRGEDPVVAAICQKLIP